MTHSNTYAPKDREDEQKQQAEYLREQKINKLVDEIMNNPTALMEHVGDCCTANDAWDEWDKLIQQTATVRISRLHDVTVVKYIQQLQNFINAAITDYAIKQVDKFN